MRNTIIAVITLATFSLLSGEASAKFTRLQKHDAAEIKSHCDTVGENSPVRTSITGAKLQRAL
jgi:hypothetical protein